MTDALTILGLTKTYPDFVLDHVSFAVPSGSIVGLIGENGAGKSTTINAALGLIQRKAGTVSIFGRDEMDNETKEQIGVVFDGSNYVFIHEGRVVFSKPKDELTERYGIIKCGAATTAVFISITSDANSKWNKNVITMPVSRGQIIGEKFVFYVILAALGMIAALVPCGILAVLGFDVSLHSLWLYGSIGISATLLTGGISLPCAYLFDPEKSQIVFMMSFMASTGIITALVLLTNLFIPMNDNILLAFTIVLTAAVICFFVSYQVAVKIYQKRDIS